MAVFHCPKCDIHKEVGPELAGKTVRCPRCGGAVEVRGRRRVVWALLASSILVLAAAGGGYFLFHGRDFEPVDADAIEQPDAADTATAERA